MTRTGFIRVLSTDDQALLNNRGRLLEEFVPDPGLMVISRCIEGHPRGADFIPVVSRPWPDVRRRGLS